MELELKHLAPYLPYGLNVYINKNHKAVMVAYCDGFLKKCPIQTVVNKGFKPILRPLSDLTKEIDKIIEEIGIHRWVDFLLEDGFRYSEIDYAAIEWCFKNHFDVFGLIEKGLAIDKNTIR